MSSLRCYLQLSANGNPIDGEPDVSTIGGDDVSTQIHVRDFELVGKVLYDEETGTPGTTRTYPPVRIRKALDKTTPELVKAFTQYLPIEATFTFYRTFTDQAAQSGGGEDGTQPYFQITGSLGRIVSIRQGRSAPFGEATDDRFQLPVEDIEITFGQLQWTHSLASVEHIDTWRDA